MRSANTLALGIMLAAGVISLHAQATTAPAGSVKATASPAAKSPAQPGKPAPVAAKPAAQATKPATSSEAKPAAKAAGSGSTTATKPAAKPVAKKPVSAPASFSPADSESSKLSRRDPFESLVGRQKALSDLAKNLPPGKAGLQVNTLRLDGVVKASNGMIAVVSNPQLRTYFLREGDQLYDGRVEKIAMDGVSFHEIGKDAFGKPVERQVNKRIYSSPGEPQ